MIENKNEEFKYMSLRNQNETLKMKKKKKSYHQRIISTKDMAIELVRK